jgi:hypothetical protein
MLGVFHVRYPGVKLTVTVGNAMAMAEKLKTDRSVTAL